MTKELIHQKDTTILNVYAPNNKASKCMKKNRSEKINRQIHNYDYGLQHLFLNNRYNRYYCIYRQKISKAIEDHHPPVGLFFIKPFHPTLAEYTFILSTHEHSFK